MGDLKGKTILIIGALNDTALNIADDLRTSGAEIILAGPDAKAIDKARTIPLDDSAALQEAVTRLPAFDGALLSPGWYGTGAFLEMTNADWSAATSQNFERMIFAAQAIAERFIAENRAGRLVFLSHVSSMMPFLQSSVMGVTLCMLWAAAKMMAVELGAHGITVNVVAAGWTDSDWARPLLHDEGRTFVEAGIPLGEIGKPGDISALCAFLLSDPARYITGAIIPVDGGYTLTRADGQSPYPAPK